MAVMTAADTFTFTVLLVTPSFEAVRVVLPTSTAFNEPVDDTVAVAVSTGVHVTELEMSEDVISLKVAVATNC